MVREASCYVVATLWVHGNILQLALQPTRLAGQALAERQSRRLASHLPRKPPSHFCNGPWPTADFTYRPELHVPGASPHRSPLA
jgi:hypothetical protein